MEYDDVEVDLKEPPHWYETVSPGGQVPCIVHGDINLVESNVITEYLNEVFQGDLMPDDAADRAHVRAIMQWADDEWMGTYKGFDEAEEDTAERKEAKAEVMEKLDAIEDKFLGPGPYLVGRDLSLADVALSSTLPFLPDKVVSQKRYPRTGAWMEALRERRSWQRVPTEPQGPVMVRGAS